MTETSERVTDFEAYLAERDLTHDAYQAMPEEMRQYIWETWQCEYKIIAPLPADTESEKELETEAPATAVVSSAQALPRQAAPHRREVDWLPAMTLACAVLMVVLAVILFAMRPKTLAGPPVEGLNPQSSDSSPVSIQPAVNAPGASQAGWQVVARADRQSSASLPFTIAGPKWRITWNTRPAATGAGDFILNVKQPGGKTLDRAAHISGEAEGEMVLRGAGSYTLEILSGQVYQVKVFDFR
jgi:hypothetical protein